MPAHFASPLSVAPEHKDTGNKEEPFHHGFHGSHGLGILHFAFCILHFLIRAIRAIRGSIFLTPFF